MQQRIQAIDACGIVAGVMQQLRGQNTQRERNHGPRAAGIRLRILFKAQNRCFEIAYAAHLGGGRAVPPQPAECKDTRSADLNQGMHGG